MAEEPPVQAAVIDDSPEVYSDASLHVEYVPQTSDHGNGKDSLRDTRAQFASLQANKDYSHRYRKDFARTFFNISEDKINMEPHYELSRYMEADEPEDAGFEAPLEETQLESQ